MGIFGFVLLLGGAVLLGIAAQSAGRSHPAYEWLIAGLGALVGAFVASEWLGAASAWGPQLDGLAVLPALIGAVVLGGIADLVARALGQSTAA